MNLEEMTKEVVELVRAKGFDNWLTWKEFPKACAYLHSEVSEAFEHWRDNEKVEVGLELADILIRLLHTARALGYDLELEFKQKMEINWKRPVHHNRKQI